DLLALLLVEQSQRVPKDRSGITTVELVEEEKRSASGIAGPVGEREQGPGSRLEVDASASRRLRIQAEDELLIRIAGMKHQRSGFRGGDRPTADERVMPFRRIEEECCATGFEQLPEVLESDCLPCPRRPDEQDVRGARERIGNC